MRTSARTWYALILFGFGVAGLWLSKPGFMFRDDGTMYEFGTGHDKSVFTFGTAVAALAIASSFVFAMGDLVATAGPRREEPRPRPGPLLGRTSAFPIPGQGRGRGASYGGVMDPFSLENGSI